jgi:hypothetical protein
VKPMASSPACLKSLPLLSPFVDGELSPAERTTLEGHLATCPDCTGRVADLRAEAALVRVGLELAADEVDFSDFAQKVMARVSPYKPPLLERLRVSLSERFTYQRGAMVGSLVAAGVALGVVSTALVLRQQQPPQKDIFTQFPELISVDVDESAHMSPLVTHTSDKKYIIIQMMPHPDYEEQMKLRAARKAQGLPEPQRAPASSAEDEEEGVQGKRGTQDNPTKVIEQPRPSGGEL